MKLVLVNNPQLIIPGGSTGNTMISLSGKATSLNTVVPIIDPTMSVDNYNVCTKLIINITYPIESPPYSSTDIITINGTSSSNTINNQPMVVMGDNGTGNASGVVATVISCGQTSTMVD